MCNREPILSSRKSGFTLVELLAVLCVMMLVISFAVPAFHDVVRNLNLVNGASMVADEFDLAWQTAVAKDTTVEVRFYQSNNGANYDTVVALIPADPNVTNSKVQWLGKAITLPNSVIIDTGDAAYSTLITSTAGSSPKTGISGSSDLALLQGKNYVCFHFRSDGSTDLDSSGSATPTAWCLTLRNHPGPSGVDGTPAANFVTILLDPVLGSTRMFQPH